MMGEGPCITIKRLAACKTLLTHELAPAKAFNKCGERQGMLIVREHQRNGQEGEIWPEQIKFFEHTAKL